MDKSVSFAKGVRIGEAWLRESVRSRRKAEHNAAISGQPAGQPAGPESGQDVSDSGQSAVLQSEPSAVLLSEQPAASRLEQPAAPQSGQPAAIPPQQAASVPEQTTAPLSEQPAASRLEQPAAKAWETELVTRSREHSGGEVEPRAAVHAGELQAAPSLESTPLMSASPVPLMAASAVPPPPPVPSATAWSGAGAPPLSPMRGITVGKLDAPASGQATDAVEQTLSGQKMAAALFVLALTPPIAASLLLGLSHRAQWIPFAPVWAWMAALLALALTVRSAFTVASRSTSASRTAGTWLTPVLLGVLLLAPSAIVLYLRLTLTPTPLRLAIAQMTLYALSLTVLLVASRSKS
ncbi:hypothetical protein [Terriglobus sp.]|uniref:hypothetical protein n=1 Tax=Terriglobus sp. TaxID=1889013 RepID=UPI003B00C32D